MESTNDVTLMTSLGLNSNISTTSEDKNFYYQRGLETHNPSTPILVLIHGYPQTNFMWRHLIPLLPSNVPLFVPDVRVSPISHLSIFNPTQVPGYGRSSPLLGHNDKRSTGSHLLTTLRSLLPHQNRASIILVGHDRGARICHRLAVDHPFLSSNFTLLGTVLLDIVPTLVQWQSMANPLVSTGSFHWPFLANVEIATAMIKAQGGDAWVRVCLDRWSGKSPSGQKSLREHNAVEVYASAFREERVLRATCDDYRAGAMEDAKLQDEDQREGKKVDVDVLVLYASAYLGGRYDVRKVWEEWMGKGSLEVVGIGEGVGHFVAEEAPGQTAAAIVEFYNNHA